MSRSPKPAGQRHAGADGKQRRARKKPPLVAGRREIRVEPVPKVEGQLASRQRPLLTAEQARVIEDADRRRRAIEQLMRHTG